MYHLLSIVIPTHNRSRTLALVLSSLVRQHKPNKVDVEVIVVDDGSTDNTEKIVHQFQNSFAGLVYRRLVHQDPVCLSKIRNIRMSAASGDILMFLDSDVVLASDALEHLVHSYTSRDEGQVLIPRILGVYARLRAQDAAAFALAVDSIDERIYTYNKDDVVWMDCDGGNNQMLLLGEKRG